MATTSGINYVHHSFAPWIGCTPASPGCANCYARAIMDYRLHRARYVAGAPRSPAAESTWKKPLAWDRAAAKAGVRRRVLLSHLSDICDPEAPPGLLDRVWELVDRCRHLDWLALTKHPQRYAEVLPWGTGEPWPHVWGGATVEDQARAYLRVPHLLRARFALRWLSMEPLLEAVEVWPFVSPQRGCEGTHRGTGSAECPRELHHHHDDRCLPCIDLLVIGGESGRDARPCDLRWVRDLVRQGRTAGAPVYVKQLGHRPYVSPQHKGATGYELRLRHPAGEDQAEWPADLRVRELPVSPAALRGAA
jgi:protein gp37